MLQGGEEKERERINTEGMPFALSRESRESFTLVLTEELEED